VTLARPRLLLLLLLCGLLSGAAACGGGSTSLPPFLCLQCGGDAECGGGANRCLDLGSGPACGVDCSSSSCPGGFVCAAITGGGRNCIPSSGTCPTVTPCNGGCQAGWWCDQATDTCVPLTDGGQVDTLPSQTDAPAPTTAVSIIVEPSDNGTALVNAIKNATTSVHMTMYLLTADKVEDALISAKNAGREVKVILNQTFPTGGDSNQAAFNRLQSAGVQVRWASSSFSLTHSKCVIIDNQAAWIMTMNATDSGLSGNREFLAIDTDPEDVAEAEAIFQADFESTPITPSGKLLVAPVNARDRLVTLITSASSTIEMEAEALSDDAIVGRLAYMAGNGVTVKIVLADDPPSADETAARTQLKAAGAQLVKVSNPYIHSKSIVVDGTTAYVGSINFTTGSMTYNREIGVIFTTPAEVQKVLTATRTDFSHGTTL
jgi:phosphatidylserine/phosphatidylglycerophosphate/cardiolipin synthase-like enzyme